MYIELAARARRLAAMLATPAPRPGSRPASRSSARSSAIVCGDVPAPVDFAGAQRTDEAAYAAFFHAMLDEGVAMAPGAYEAIFVGLGHTDAVLDHVGAAAERAARTRRRAILTAPPAPSGASTGTLAPDATGAVVAVPRRARLRWWGSPARQRCCSVGSDTVARVVERSGPAIRRADLVALVVDAEAAGLRVRRNGSAAA